MTLREAFDVALTSQHLVFRVLRFGIVGGMASLIYLVLSLLLILQFAMEPVTASVISYIVAMPFSFLGQRNFTFRANGDRLRQLVRFLLLNAAGLALSVALMNILHVRLGLHPAVPTLLTVVLVPLLSFVVMQLLIFTDRKT